MLVAVAERLRRSVRYGDTVGRLGGDEFLVLCEQVSSEHEAVVIVERILKALDEPLRIDGQTIYPSASIGVAVDSQESVGVETLIANADAAMYLAKGNAIRRYAIFDHSLAAKTADRMQDEHELRMAIENDQLRVLYQPQLDLATGTVVGAEAVVRWDHPVRGLIAPQDFIQLAEETGLIVPLGRWVLDRICTQLADWADSGPLGSAGRVWMNVSATELASPSLVDRIIDTLASSGANPAQLGIEVTEVALMHYPDVAADVLARLESAGVAVALDDFGSGHASLAYLSRFPVAAIKLDRGFVAELDSGDVAKAIAASIVTLAGGLKLEVIAEGIEKEAQVESLLRLGISRGQGFFYAPALPSDELAAYRVS